MKTIVAHESYFAISSQTIQLCFPPAIAQLA
jgi:hypothetical protein